MEVYVRTFGLFLAILVTLGFVAVACNTINAFAQFAFLPGLTSHAVTPPKANHATTSNMSAGIVANVTKVSPAININFTGNIASLQNAAFPWDPWFSQFHKNAIWILSGKWSFIAEQASSNTTILSGSSPTFNASFTMERLNGTEYHKHSISDFKLLSRPNFNATENSITFRGTSTVVMKNGPVRDVPTNITMLANRAIKIALGPGKTDRHFGWEPIYGIVTKIS